ncbi:hypothetical protein YA16_07595, partial [Klebsiella aerogenes]
LAGTGSATLALTEAIKSLSNVSGREADILIIFLCYYLNVAMLYGYIETEVRISLFLDHN